MDTQGTDQIGENIITAGRAYVRLIEAADVLLDQRPVWTERVLLRRVWVVYRHRLRGLVAVLPSGLTGEILAASEKITEPVRGFGENEAQQDPPVFCVLACLTICPFECTL